MILFASEKFTYTSEQIEALVPYFASPEDEYGDRDYTEFADGVVLFQRLEGGLLWRDL